MGLRVINMAGYSAHVSYAIEEVLMRPMGIYNDEYQIAKHPMPQTSNPTLDTAPRFECYTERESCVISQRHIPLSKIFDRRRGTITILPTPEKRDLNQALPSSTAALIEAKNFAGQVDSSASLGMPFSRTCLMMLCCSLAINS